MKAFAATFVIAATLIVPGQRRAAAEEALTYADLIRRVADLRQPAVPRYIFALDRVLLKPLR